jgi:hypothetical protein
LSCVACSPQAKFHPNAVTPLPWSFQVMNVSKKTSWEWVNQCFHCLVLVLLQDSSKGSMFNHLLQFLRDLEPS